MGSFQNRSYHPVTMPSPFPATDRHADGALDLQVLAVTATDALMRALTRRQQFMICELPPERIEVIGERAGLLSLIGALLREAAGLSSACAVIRIICAEDEGDSILTVLGSNRHLPSGSRVDLDADLAAQARAMEAELKMIWTDDDGPTFVLRFPHRMAA
jgi:hypothetical protein